MSQSPRRLKRQQRRQQQAEQRQWQSTSARTLLRVLMRSANISQAEAVIVVRSITAAIAALLQIQERIAIPKLGVFVLCHVGVHEGHNFLINRRMSIPARTEVRFKMAQELRLQLNPHERRRLRLRQQQRQQQRLEQCGDAAGGAE